MKISILFQALIFLVLLNSCSGDENENNNSEGSPPQITTATVQFVNGIDVLFGGNLIINDDNQSYTAGVCWSTSTLPIVDSNAYNFVLESVYESGPFDIVSDVGFLPNTTYYARAFTYYGDAILYGNEVSFTIPEVLTTLDPSEILTTTATLNGHFMQGPQEIENPGFVYGTSQNPTINNNLITDILVGTDDYSITISNLQPNTIYYVRSCVSLNGTPVYGTQKQFRTTGYTGPAGGYVAYDKGMVSDGWRYMEIHPTTLNFNVSWSTGAAWGVYGTFISGTSGQFGTGPANTELIAANTAQANCAAKLCQNLTLNGFNDWFLPSSDEMMVISNTLLKAGINLGDYSWTSTQVDANYAKSMVYRTNPPRYEIYNSNPKSFDNLNVYPVRRYE